MAESPIMASKSSASNGFWGSVFSGIGGGLEKVATEVLPVWTAKQLDVEYNPAGKTGNPLNTSLGDILGLPGSGLPQATGKQNFMDFGDSTNQFSVQPNTFIAAGIVIVGLIVLFKVM
jgi:hypothetical protein